MAKRTKTPVDYDRARGILESAFATVEAGFISGEPAPVIQEDLRGACEALFRSSTQSHREVLLGCLVAKILDRSINVRMPYVKQGPSSISLRIFSEKVTNAFLQQKRVPSSIQPYLAVFRRGWQFTEDYPASVKDEVAYKGLLLCISYIESRTDESDLLHFLRCLLRQFIELREAAAIPLTRIQRISLDQFDSLISHLLSTPSGGRFPVLLVTAAFLTIKEYFNLNWSISAQGINVADVASGAGGDITIASGEGQTLMAVEVTERPVDKARVVATFQTKIAPAGIEDYLFFTKVEAAAQEAKEQARQYFAQGHELNFVEIKQWITGSLATMGKRGRAIFNRVLLELLDKPDTPKLLKVAWNQQLAQAIGS
jgi:hypothetical protein